MVRREWCLHACLGGGWLSKLSSRDRRFPSVRFTQSTPSKKRLLVLSLGMLSLCCAIWRNILCGRQLCLWHQRHWGQVLTKSAKVVALFLKKKILLWWEFGELHRRQGLDAAPRPTFRRALRWLKQARMVRSRKTGKEGGGGRVRVRFGTTARPRSEHCAAVRPRPLTTRKMWIGCGCVSCALAMDSLVAYLRRCLSIIPTPCNPHHNVSGLSAALGPKFPP